MHCKKIRGPYQQREGQHCGGPSNMWQLDDLMITMIYRCSRLRTHYVCPEHSLMSCEATKQYCSLLAQQCDSIGPGMQDIQHRKERQPGLHWKQTIVYGVYLGEEPPALKKANKTCDSW